MSDESDNTPDDKSISLEELSQSFAQLIGESKPPVPPTTADEATDDVYSLEDDCPTTPQTILEAMLFVGHPSNESLTNRQMASLIRGVSPKEVDSLVTDLNASYESNFAPYRIIPDEGGYRMALLPEYDAIREHFYGRIRRARLSQSAIDTLALVAYNQPITKDRVEKLRQRPSGAVMSQMVKRGLLSVETVEDTSGPRKRRKKVYSTTDRFLDLFGLESIDDLPRSQDMGPSF